MYSGWNFLWKIKIIPNFVSVKERKREREKESNLQAIVAYIQH